MAKHPSIEEVLASLSGGKSSPYVIDRERGVFQADGPDDHRRAMEMMEAAERLARVQAESQRGMPPAQRAPAEPPAPSGFTIQQAIDLWEAIGHGSLAKSTIEAKRSIITSFAEHYGPNRPVADVRRPDVSAWHVHLAKNKKNAGVTRNNKAGHLSAFFDFVKAQGHYAAGLENPAEGTGELSRNERSKRAKSHGWVPFTVEQLKQLFDPKNLARAEEPHTRRGMVIGLYTGARVSEVAKLRVDDFKVVEGVHCIHWQGDFKTERTNRVVPIHPDLIKLGLLNWVEQQRERKQTRLFPGVKIDGHNQGGAISKGAANLMVRLGITVPEGSTNRVGFHSFRSNVIQALQAAKPAFPEERRRAYTGHGKGDKADTSAHAINYMRPWKPKEIEALHAGIPWGEWLDFPALRELLIAAEKDEEAVMQQRVAARRETMAKKKAKD